MAKVRLGDTVRYTDGAGFEKAALVVGTRRSVQDGTAIKRPEKGSANLRIYSPSGQVYTRENVPQGDGPRTFAL